MNTRPITTLPERPAYPDDQPEAMLSCADLRNVASIAGTALPPIVHDPSIEQDGHAACLRYELMAHESPQRTYLTPAFSIAVGPAMLERHLPGSVLHELIHKRVLLKRLNDRPRRTVERVNRDRVDGHGPEFRRISSTTSLPFPTGRPRTFPFSTNRADRRGYRNWAEEHTRRSPERPVHERPAAGPTVRQKRRRAYSYFRLHCYRGAKAVTRLFTKGGCVL